MDEPYRSDPVATLPPHKKHCFACAGVLDIRAELCPRCGIRQPPIPGVNAPAAETALVARPAQPLAKRPRRDRVTASVLAILFGSIGLQKFYMGQFSAGVLCLAFFWSGVPTLLGFIEGAQLLSMSDEEFDTRNEG